MSSSIPAADVFLERLVDAILRLGDAASDAPAFFGLQQDLSECVASGYPGTALARELRRTVDDPSRLGRWKPNELVLFANQQAELSIWSFSRARQYLHTVSSHTMLAPCTSTPLAWRRFRLPAHYDNRLFDRNLKVEYVDEGTTRAGDVLCMPAGGPIYDFLIDEPTPVVKLTFGPIETMEWLFHRDTGAAWKISDSDPAATQMRVGAYILGQMSHPSSAPALKQLTHHGSHAVRWAAIQALSRISVSDALERLRTAVTDPHPHIRRAAERTLAALQPKRPS